MKASRATSSSASLIGRRPPGAGQKPAQQKQTDNAAVWKVEGQGIVRVPVKAGATDGTMTQVLEGNLVPGSYVATDIMRAEVMNAQVNEMEWESKQPLIELKEITKVYGKGQAALRRLRGIDLSIYEGDFVAVMGPSGCGKSTCMNLLGCLDTPTSGQYLFRGIDIGNLSRNQRALLQAPLPRICLSGIQPA